MTNKLARQCSRGPCGHQGQPLSRSTTMRPPTKECAPVVPVNVRVRHQLQPEDADL